MIYTNDNLCKKKKTSRGTLSSVCPCICTQAHRERPEETHRGYTKLFRAGAVITTVISYMWFSAVAQSCPTLCDPMNRNMPVTPDHHHLLEFTQTHIHRVSDAIQPSHPLSSASPPAHNPCQHQSLFQ